MNKNDLLIFPKGKVLSLIFDVKDTVILVKFFNEKDKDDVWFGDRFDDHAESLNVKMFLMNNDNFWVKDIAVVDKELLLKALNDKKYFLQKAKQ